MCSVNLSLKPIEIIPVCGSGILRSAHVSDVVFQNLVAMLDGWPPILDERSGGHESLLNHDGSDIVGRTHQRSGSLLVWLPRTERTPDQIPANYSPSISDILRLQEIDEG